MPLSNPFVNISAAGNGGDCKTGHGCATAFRQGRWKLIQGNPGSAGVCHLPPPSSTPVKFGASGGTITPPDHCAGGSWVNNETFPTYNIGCNQPFCIFDVMDDPAEQHDLSGTANGAAAGQRLMARLQILSRSGAQEPGLSYPGRSSDGYRDVLKPMICARANATGFWLPADWPLSGPLSPPPSPPPSPHFSCKVQLQHNCPLPFRGGDKACLKCTREHHGECSPKERQAYCSGIHEVPYQGDSTWHY